MIQTAAPLAPGSTGGALVDRTGGVIGITTALAVTDTVSDGIGFATPIDIARDTAEQLITTGRAIHVWIGVEGEDVDAATASKLSVKGGALVRTVRAKSPAAASGLEPQDVIVAVEGHSVTSMSDLVVALRAHRPGQNVTIGYLRDGQPGSAKVTLAERPKGL
jgi:S1-C subfamily serine protease